MDELRGKDILCPDCKAWSPSDEWDALPRIDGTAGVCPECGLLQLTANVRAQEPE